MTTAATGSPIEIMLQFIALSRRTNAQIVLANKQELVLPIES